MGRATQGVRLISLRGDDEIAAVAKVYRDREEDDLTAYDEDGNPIVPEMVVDSVSADDIIELADDAIEEMDDEIIEDSEEEDELLEDDEDDVE
jgi:DNA gyrase subunit A